MADKVQKALSANDTGETKSHQAGVHVPKVLASFFPVLDERALNPSVWIELVGRDGSVWRCRYIHYNNAVVASGTRNEYRITWLTDPLRQMGASAGDTLEFEHVSEHRYSINLVRQGSTLEAPDGRLIVNVARGWRTVRR